ncbi:hypothetical protein K1T71_009195 [Dendrolimus kikuchii]|uniref:Uncharacterized protein n=1 Tax=Dendrolimus kikuchii TaxID=765133 RepID=A0ACC1CTT2_9NEOP|nr:hypothetical protein K1T71_009195 [Dendrolimus kikuchii]
MSIIKVNFEIGHEASLKSKKTPEGFTHDWEVFVRGPEGSDISHFVDKVVFHLHETFPKPKRVVKEPPYSIKEQGYAGFPFPIDIYLKNKEEPKKIRFVYDFTLQQSGFLKDRYIFKNPNEDFQKKLVKGGGFPMPSTAYYSNPDQESRSRDSFSEEKPQLISKPKLSSDNVKKHKIKEHKEEVPYRASSFENLFGPPIQKPPKVSPDPKKLEKSALSNKSDKKDKDRSSSDKKSKHDHKEAKQEKIKIKDDKDKVRTEKMKSSSKDVDKSKEKSSKRPNERPPSPDTAKKRCISPVRRVPSPQPRSNSASSSKEDFKSSKHIAENIELKKPRVEEKQQEAKIDKEQKEKKKKEKKSHDRDKERKEKKEHKRESHKLKESPKEPPKEVPKDLPKPREIVKEKEPVKEISPVKEKPTKSEKPIKKFSIENLKKTPPPENDEHLEGHKIKEKSKSENKHKHKKKDKKRDESREKHKEAREKKHKHDKIRDTPVEKLEVIEQVQREAPVPKERPIAELASPISIDTASQCSSKSGLTKPSHISIDDANSSHSDSESSIIAEEDVKVKTENLSPEPVIKHEPSPEPEPEPEPEPDPEPVVEAPPQPKEKSKKHKDKSSKREEKRRKRKAAEEEENENRKVVKTETSAYPEVERGESSGSTSVETKVQDNGVSSSLGEEPEPGELSPDYMVQLRDLQQRIMKIKNNEDLERVVNLIAETGRYEVTTQTFDFDLCLLDRSTVQQLIQLVGC